MPIEQSKEFVDALRTFPDPIRVGPGQLLPLHKVPTVYPHMRSSFSQLVIDKKEVAPNMYGIALTVKEYTESPGFFEFPLLLIL